MNITLSTDVKIPEATMEITVSGVDDGVKVAIQHKGIVMSATATVGADSVLTIPWDKVEDVEHLADLFKFELVCVFKAVVVLLGKVYVLKDAE